MNIIQSIQIKSPQDCCDWRTWDKRGLLKVFFLKHLAYLLTNRSRCIIHGQKYDQEYPSQSNGKQKVERPLGYEWHIFKALLLFFVLLPKCQLVQILFPAWWLLAVCASCRCCRWLPLSTHVISMYLCVSLLLNCI